MLVTINYHYIRHSFDLPYPSIHGVTPDQFKKQLIILSRFGAFIHPLRLKEAIEQGTSIPSRSLFVTFDDGLREQYELALPILDELGIPALFFVITSVCSEKKVSSVHKIHIVRSIIPPDVLLARIVSYAEAIGGIAPLTKEEEERALFHYDYESPDVARLKYVLNFKCTSEAHQHVIDRIFQEHFDEKKVYKELYMDDAQLADLAHRNFLGSHGYEHVPHASLSDEALRSSLHKSFSYFSRVPYTPFAISYPYGSREACGGNLSRFARDAGFVYGFTMEKAGADSFKNPLLLPRFDCIDLPGGKNNTFGDAPLFSSVQPASWFEKQN